MLLTWSSSTLLQLSRLWALCKVSNLAHARASCWLGTLAALLEVREGRKRITTLLVTQLFLSICTSLFSAFNASTSILISPPYSQSLFCHSHQQMLSRSKGTNLGIQFPGRIVHALDLNQGQVVLAGRSGRAQPRDSPWQASMDLGKTCFIHSCHSVIISIQTQLIWKEKLDSFSDTVCGKSQLRRGQHCVYMDWRLVQWN